MCFSPEASFAAAIGLAAIGGATLAMKPPKQRLAFALIPLFFAAQQTIEGFIWLSMNANGASPPALTVAYLFFAQIFWPTYTPLSVLMMETRKRRRRALFVLLGVGVLVSAILLAVLIRSEYTVSVIHHSLNYETGHRFEKELIGLYLVAITAPLFISRHRYVLAFGATVLIGSFVSALFFSYASASVWCFFAAIASVFVYLHIRRRNRIDAGQE